MPGKPCVAAVVGTDWEPGSELDGVNDCAVEFELEGAGGNAGGKEPDGNPLETELGVDRG